MEITTDGKIHMATESTIPNAVVLSDSETESTQTKCRRVSFKEDPNIFIIHRTDFESPVDTFEENNEEEKTQTNEDFTKNNKYEDTDSRSNKTFTEIDSNDSVNESTSSDTLELQERWEQYEKEKHKLDEMEKILAKRRTEMDEQEDELEEFEWNLEQRHRKLTREEEDLCVLQDELDNLSDLLNEKTESISKIDQEVVTSPQCNCYMTIDEMQRRLEQKESMECELRDKIKVKDTDITKKNELISRLETENKQLFDKIEQMESRWNSSIDRRDEDTISNQISSVESSIMEEKDITDIMDNKGVKGDLELGSAGGENWSLLKSSVTDKKSSKTCLLM